jgi:hypothetical protein
MVRTALLFTRGHESVHLEVQDGRFGPQLLIRGPGSASRLCDFQDLGSLLEYQSSYEKELLDDGYRLCAIAERRSGEERRTKSRTKRDRRRT